MTWRKGLKTPTMKSCAPIAAGKGVTDPGATATIMAGLYGTAVAVAPTAIIAPRAVVIVRVDVGVSRVVC